MLNFTQKDPGETELFTFSFVNMLAPTETITSAAVTSTVVAPGVDSDPGAMIDGAAIVNNANKSVGQLITGGILNNSYHLQCTITTSAGQTLKLCGNLPILAC